MSTATMQNTAAPVAGKYNVNFGGVLRSEWRKLWSLRATWILSSVAAAIMVLFAGGGTLLIGLTMTGDASTEKMPSELVHLLASSGLMIAGLLWAAVVVVNIAGEYNSHSAVSTFSAVPRRYPVYIAKALLTGVVGLLGGMALYLLSFLLVVGVANLFPFKADLDAGLMWPNTVLSGLYVLVLTWMGLGMGALMRNTAGAIVTLAVFVYLVTSVLATFALFNAPDWVTWLSNHLPTQAVDGLRPQGELTRMATGSGGAETLAVWDSWLTIAVWALVPLGLGAWANQKRPVR